MINLISKTNLIYLFSILCLFGNNILKVNSQQINDCTIFKDAIPFMGEKYNKFEINDCCSLSDVITCENNHITEIKLIDFNCDDNTLNLESAIRIFGKLEYLTSFQISQTNWCKEIPYNLLELKNLKTLILTHNAYSNILPENLSKLTNLEKLDLSDNGFTGEIPYSYGELKNLKCLKLNGNSLSGYIPFSFKELENLTEFNLAGNEGIVGYIPKMSKIDICDYESTNLCKLKSTTCTTNLKNDCTKDDVKRANNFNGNPNPENKDFEGDVKFSFVRTLESIWVLSWIVKAFPASIFILIVLSIFLLIAGILIYEYLCSKLSKIKKRLSKKN